MLHILDPSGVRLTDAIWVSTLSAGSAQVVIVPIVRKETDRPAVNEAADKLHAALKGAGIRCKVGPLLLWFAATLHWLILARVNSHWHSDRQLRWILPYACAPNGHSSEQHTVCVPEC
jgi:hypothetical protein